MSSEWENPRQLQKSCGNQLFPQPDLFAQLALAPSPSAKANVLPPCSPPPSSSHLSCGSHHGLCVMVTPCVSLAKLLSASGTNG